ncbi:MAG: hypothetical protein HKN67_03845 [Saprospiraceae bacterium]|nr:hypothetical protein [Bacteroidia bacterium]MBT8229809.1 hypothetical protein [Bacteroidia bacterium]NNF21050.1 hypothetical protein [Saprospiraceae bacterium]
MNNRISFELIWILITSLFVGLVMLPVYLNLGMDFPFYIQNIGSIIIAITFIRYIFLLKHHFFTLHKWFKVAFIFIPIPVFIFLVDVISEFQAFYDEEGIHSIMKDLSYQTQRSMSTYIRTEVVFFWTAAMISTIFLPIRMIISLWREINKGTH